MIGRSISLISAFALTVGLASCKAPTEVSETVQSEKTDRFEQTLDQAKAMVEARLGDSLVIPVPKDPGGGYTHETR